MSASKRENAGADFVILSQSSSSSSDGTNSSCGFGKIVSTPSGRLSRGAGTSSSGLGVGSAFSSTLGTSKSISGSTERVAKCRGAVDGEVVVEQVGFEHDVIALQDFVTEDDVAKGAVEEDFVVEYLFVEDEVREEDEWAKANRTRSGSASSTREGLALGWYRVRSVPWESWECNPRTVKCRGLEIDESPATKS